MIINTRIFEELLLVSKSAAKHHLAPLAAHSAVRKLLGEHMLQKHTVIQAGCDLDLPAKSDQVAQSCIQVCSD